MVAGACRMRTSCSYAWLRMSVHCVRACVLAHACLVGWQCRHPAIRFNQKLCIDSSLIDFNFRPVSMSCLSLLVI